MTTILLYTMMMLAITFVFGFFVAFLIENIGNVLLYCSTHTVKEMRQLMVANVRNNIQSTRSTCAFVRSVDKNTSIDLLAYHYSYNNGPSLQTEATPELVAHFYGDAKDTEPQIRHPRDISWLAVSRTL